MGHHHRTGRPDAGRPDQRRNRGGFGGPPPWLIEMFGSGGRGFGTGFGGPGGPGPRGRHGARGMRARRGDVRAAILDVLATAVEGGRLNGYQVIQQIAERTGGAWKPSPGSVYPTIQQLEDEGLVVTDETAGRKVLGLTAEGTAYVAEHPDEMAQVWAPFADEGEPETGQDLKKVIGQTMSAVWQIASTGTSAQVEEAAVVLAETRRRLYTILAEGDGE